MILRFEIGNKSYSADTSNPARLSIELRFDGDQPNSYDAEKASAKAYETEGFIGDTRRGGSCNFEQYKLVPHCNGTHTECVGHISFERISVNKTLNDVFIPSTLITVTPEKATDTKDTYIPEKQSGDMMITKKILDEKIRHAEKHFLKGLLIRTIPNDDSKKSRRYMKNEPPFFSVEAMEYIRSLGVENLMIDIPSVDRTFDQGMLTAHHIFWDVKSGSHDVSAESHSLKTITEMIFAPDEIEDGAYLVNLQIPDFTSDAAPSRIFAFKAQPVAK